MLLALLWILAGCDAPPEPGDQSTPVAYPEPALATPIPYPEPTLTTPRITETQPRSVETPTATPDKGVLPGQDHGPGEGPVQEAFLSRIAMMSLEEGWAITTWGILRSESGGRSWVDVSPDEFRKEVTPQEDLYDPEFVAAFPDSETAVVVAITGDSISVYRTADGGARWDKATISPENEPLYLISLHFLEADHGWLLTSRGIGLSNEWVDLYQTEDGGATWTFRAGSDSESGPSGRIRSGGNKTGISFNSPEMGWLTGSAPIDTIYLYRTQDGGASWEAQIISTSENAVYPVSSYPPVFFDDGRGALPVSIITQSGESGMLFFVTEDGGESWESGTPVEGGGVAWDWIDARNGFVVTMDSQQEAQLFKTADGGDTWETFPVELQNVRQVDFVTEQAGWAICGYEAQPLVDCAGDLYRTADGGRSWEKIFP